MTQVKRRKGWRMSCDVGEVKERLENELGCFMLPVISATSSLFSVIFFPRETIKFDRKN